jgi:hypothetical protein
MPKQNETLIDVFYGDGQKIEVEFIEKKKGEVNFFRRRAGHKGGNSFPDYRERCFAKCNIWVS